MHLRHTVIASTLHDFDLYLTSSSTACTLKCSPNRKGSIMLSWNSNSPPGKECWHTAVTRFKGTLFSGWKDNPAFRHRQLHMRRWHNCYYHPLALKGKIMPMAVSLNRNLIESRILYASSVVMYVSCSNVLHILAETRTAKTRICIFISYISSYVSYI
jgi:hypothetical protein